MFEHIQKLSFSYFDKTNTGELMSRIKDDTENILNAISFGIMLSIEQGLYIIIATVILFELSWEAGTFNCFGIACFGVFCF